MPERGGPTIIDTIKIRRGNKDVFVPVNPEVQPLNKEAAQVEAYDRIGRKKKASLPKGKTRDIGA